MRKPTVILQKKKICFHLKNYDKKDELIYFSMDRRYTFQFTYKTIKIHQRKTKQTKSILILCEYQHNFLSIFLNQIYGSTRAGKQNYGLTIVKKTLEINYYKGHNYWFSQAIFITSKKDYQYR
jgi:hypothetical protein